MGKKSLDDCVMKLLNGKMTEEERTVNEAIGQFYPDGVLSDFVREENPFEAIMAALGKEDQKAMMDEGALNRCLQIRDEALSGNPHFLMVDFDKRIQIFNGIATELGNTAIKLGTEKSTKPTYLFSKKEERWKVLLLVGEDHSEAFIVFQNDDGAVSIMRLFEIYLLSLLENEKENLERLMMTTYLQPHPKICVSVIIGTNNLAPVKSMFLADMLKIDHFAQKVEVMNAEKKCGP